MTSAVTNTTPISTNTWHTLTFVYNSDTPSTPPLIYVDGVVQATTVTAALGSYSTDAGNNMRVGENTAGGGLTFDGDIEMITMWNVSLTADQAAQVHNAIRTRFFGGGGGAGDNLGNHTATQALDMAGFAVTNTSSVEFQETGGGTDAVTLQAPTAVTSSYSLTLPEEQGGPGQALINDGTGTLSFLPIDNVPDGFVVPDCVFYADFNNAASFPSGQTATWYDLINGVAGTTSNTTVTNGHINFNNTTSRVDWDQPHEGNLFEHLYRQRALQGLELAATAVAGG